MVDISNIQSLEDIDEIVLKSQERIQIIFKHSTACPISRIAYEKFKSHYPLENREAEVYYLGVIEQRAISNYVADKLNIKHESPQMLVLRNGQVIFNESHLMIDPQILVSL